MTRFLPSLIAHGALTLSAFFVGGLALANVHKIRVADELWMQCSVPAAEPLTEGSRVTSRVIVPATPDSPGHKATPRKEWVRDFSGDGVICFSDRTVARITPGPKALVGKVLVASSNEANDHFAARDSKADKEFQPNNNNNNNN